MNDVNTAREPIKKGRHDASRVETVMELSPLSSATKPISYRGMLPAHLPLVTGTDTTMGVIKSGNVWRYRCGLSGQCLCEANSLRGEVGIVCGGAEDITSFYSVTGKSTCVSIEGLDSLQINEPLHIPPPIWLRDGSPSGSVTALA